MPPMNPKGPTMALQDLKNWFADKGLRIAHAATLARFEKQLYDHKDNTITPVEAFNLGLLSPQSLLSPLLATQVGSFTNTDMLSIWNDASLDFKIKNGTNHPGAIPLNNLLMSATFGGDTNILDWLLTIKEPTQALCWDADHLLTLNLKTAHWAMMWHKDLLQTDDPYGIVRKSLSGFNFVSRTWLEQVDKANTSYESSRRSMSDVHAHAHNLMHTYFPEMPWQERWTTFADPLAPVSPNPPTFNRDGIQGRLPGEVYIAGLLYNAPVEIQQCLAAFKRSHHPKEEPSLHLDTGPKAIRHTFFGDPAPLAGVDPALAAWLSIMQGTPVQEAANAWVDWQSNTQTMHTPTTVSLPSDLLESSAP